MKSSGFEVLFNRKISGKTKKTNPKIPKAAKRPQPNRAAALENKQKNFLKKEFFIV